MNNELLNLNYIFNNNKEIKLLQYYDYNLLRFYNEK